MGRIEQAVFKFKTFSKKQKQVLTWWMSNSPVSNKNGIIADGAIRAGKTVSMALSFVIWAMESFDGENFAMCGKTIGSFRRNVLTVLMLMLRSRGYKAKYHRTDNLVEITRLGRTNHFYIFGGKDERSQDLIQGITLAGVFFDEVALMPESFVNQATARCSVEGSKWWFNCNPEGPYHWFNLEWVEKAEEKGLLHLHFTMDDNLSLSEEIKKRYISLYSGVFFKRYILGLWVVAEGIIYDMFDEDRHVVETLDDVEGEGQYVSVDYGTQNATVFLLWEKNKDDKWVCIKEYYYSGRDEDRQKTDAEYANDLENFVPNKNTIKSIIVDPSAASFIAELKQRGWMVKKAKNDVLDGIRTVATLLNLDEILFYKDCVNMIKEFHSYSWNSKAKGQDAPLQEKDHASDSLRYFAYTIIRRERKWENYNV